MNDLQGLNILVTRPDPGGQELCQMITESGGKAVHFPTLAITPPSDLQALAASITLIGSQDWLIFISPQAVYNSIPAIRRAWPYLSENIQLATVGKGTATALKHGGWVPAVFPEYQGGSESLLSLPAFQSVQGKKIMLVRGEGGREVLAATLQARGAIVSHLIAYRRTLPLVEKKACRDILQQQQINAVVATSYEALRNYQLLGGDSDIPIIVMSDRIKMLAKNLDFQTIWPAQRASIEAILELLAERKEELWQIKKMKS